LTQSEAIYRPNQGQRLARQVRIGLSLCENL
jgi:hypothetical protein